ncbi:aminoglycoside 3-N-acetyltransferase [Acetomicrobium flavidum]|uniref:Aminoglycoside N(3)-acetyltransferase n=2 Tax=Acetomicrobium flavidum TaxID=49896 RepID=A0ABY1JBY9_9BACT|nr:aminoglycoside 3-N-acetyltransferase [Acetomicrobium flavidum]
MMDCDERGKDYLYICDDSEKIYYADIADALCSANIEKGDIIFVHSDVSVFGKLGNIRDRDKFLGMILNAFKEAVGSEGTIIMPTFTYSFTKGETYCPETSPSTVGVLTEFFRKQSGVTRTIHPIFSAAVWGKEKAYFTEGLSKDSFDDDSIFGKLRKKKGKLVFFGVDFHVMTFLHHIEQKHVVPYRYMKSFTGRIKVGDKEYEDTYTYYVRYLDKNVVTDASRFERYALECGALKEVKLGYSAVKVARSNDIFDVGYELLDKDIFFFLKDKVMI